MTTTDILASLDPETRGHVDRDSRRYGWREYRAPLTARVSPATAARFARTMSSAIRRDVHTAAAATAARGDRD